MTNDERTNAVDYEPLEAFEALLKLNDDPRIRVAHRNCKAVLILRDAEIVSRLHVILSQNYAQNHVLANSEIRALIDEIRRSASG